MNHFTVSSTEQPSSGPRRLSTRSLVLAGMFAAVLAVISQISIPLPTGVPVTVQVFGVALAGSVLGWKTGCLAVLVYILLGAAGLPIFSNFSGGLQCLAGMTGGYILAWPVLALLSGLRIKHAGRTLAFVCSAALSVTGLMIVELAGGLQWSLLAEGMSFKAVMAYSLAAFIPKDIVLTLLALMVGEQIRRPLAKEIS